MRSALNLSSLACLIAGLFISCNEHVCAQSAPLTEGMHFIVGFIHPERAPGEPLTKNAYRVIVSSTLGATVQVGTRSVSVKAGDVIEVGIDSCDVLPIHADKPISVSARILMSGNGEQSIQLPTYAWGTSYRPFSWWTDRYGLGGMTYAAAKRLVIARDSNTFVRYHRNGSLVDTTLNAGEYFYISSSIDTSSYRTSASDPTGERIEATRPIMVLSGHPKAAVLEHPDALPSTGTYARALNRSRGTLMEAMLPESCAGTTFVSAPLQYAPTRKRGLDLSNVGVADDRGDVIRIIALANGTVVSRHGADGTSIVDTLDAGQVFTQRTVEHPYVWNTTKPALCAQYGKSYAHITSQATLPEDDPSTEAGLPVLLSLPGTDRWVHSTSFQAPSDLVNYLTVTTRHEYAKLLLLDGKQLSQRSKTDTVTSEFVALTCMVSSGMHTVSVVKDNARFAAYTYGSNDGLQLCQAYASLAGIDMSQPCADSIFISTQYTSDTAHCTYGVTSALPSDSCVSLGFAMQYVQDSYNCTWTHHVGEFIFIRTNASDSAYANVTITSRSGQQLREHIAFSKPTSIHDFGQLARIVVYPQPAFERISVQIPSNVPHPDAVRLVSMYGMATEIDVRESSFIDVDVRSYTPGVYMLHVDTLSIPVVVLR